MKIGEIQIDSLIDGEVLAPADACYHGHSPQMWTPHGEHLDSFSGWMLNSIGAHLVRAGDRLVMVDAGVGPQPTYPFVGGGLRSSMRALGVRPSDITDVVFTHLHMDHIGWASVDGRPFFENATYHVDGRDWAHFMSPEYEMPEWESAGSEPTRDAAVVRLDPIRDRIEIFEGDHEILPGVVAVEASGHTPGSTVLRLLSDGEEGMLIGDLVHSVPELTQDNWVFALHHDPDRAMASIESIRKELSDRHLPFAAAHFPGMQWGIVERENDSSFAYRVLKS